MDVLLRYGADVNVKVVEGKTALYIAALNGNFGILRSNNSFNEERSHAFLKRSNIFQ